MSLNNFMDIGLIIAFIGVGGILVNKRNILLAIISVELMFYGINFYLVVVSLFLDDIVGEIFAIFILTLAAAESALALALITAYFRVYQNILIKEFKD